ncbi:hypothetical protein IMSHALPRED_002845 [Imshaugia aleurites]|uniref:Uncharacterized protein n=1 Tax=Imshaugia aleurites TaxID=172621 RepID=A0A8H3J6K4_9LECA|nr:hypothetical protein IMSHALPRED_002845 [Imshaugia aleurites]
MAWVRPKHPKRKVEVDPTESLRPVLEFFSCTRPSASNSNNRQLARIPKKPLLLLDSYEPRPLKHNSEELDHHRGQDDHHQKEDHHPPPEHHQRPDHHSVDYDRASYHERPSQRSTSHYTRETSPPPPPPPLPSYKFKARPGAHLRLMPSRHHLAAENYSSRMSTSRWASATTPLEI